MTVPPLIGIATGTRQAPDSGAVFVALRPTYPHAVEKGGGVPVIIPTLVGEDTLRQIYERLDGIVISGGGDVDPASYKAAPSDYIYGVDPVRDQAEFQIVRWAVEDDKPLLAICRGIQVLNVALGGTLIQHIPAEVKEALVHANLSDEWFYRLAHEVTIAQDSKLYRALGINTERLSVNSLHHQGLGQVAPQLRVVARADDGVVEGVELPDRRFILGVQWHPEALVDEHPPMLHLFESLVDAAKG
jgi:putative glutamine amidotransferase